MSESLKERVERFLWHGDASERRLLRAVRLPARYLYALLRDLTEGQLTLRAMGLVYTTLLSLVPLLAFSFSVLKGFGVHHQAEPLLLELLRPLGPRADDITAQIISFVDNVKGGVLGGIGLMLLMYTVISMIHKVEDTFNYIWQVQRSRSLARRFSDYLSVILIGPVLMVTAMGLLATVSSSAIMQEISEVEPIGFVLGVGGRLAPFVVVMLVFSFFYAFVPNTRVRAGPALLAGLAAGAAWTAAGSIFAAFIVGSTRYEAIYSGFAIAITALIWLYLSWLILLIGAQLSFFLQNPRRLRVGRSQLKLSIAQTERLALAIMHEVGLAFRSGERRDFGQLAEFLDQPARALEDITARLAEAGLLTQTENGGFVPGRDLATIELVDILAAVRGEHSALPSAAVSGLLREIRSAEAACLEGRSLANLVDGEGE
jgi:membrane protein